jgi:hypothetical protein
MKSLRKTSISMAAIMAVAMFYFSCTTELKQSEPASIVARVTGMATLTGKIYNGLNRTQITGTTDSTLSGTLTYIEPGSGTVKTISAKIDTATGIYVFSQIPSETPFTVEFSAGTSFQNLSMKIVE